MVSLSAYDRYVIPLLQQKGVAVVGDIECRLLPDWQAVLMKSSQGLVCHKYISEPLIL